MNHTFPAVAPKPPHRTWVLHACQIAVVLILAAETSHARADEAADGAWPPATSRRAVWNRWRWCSLNFAESERVPDSDKQSGRRDLWRGSMP